MEKFKTYYLGALKNNYFNFNGRAGLAEFWYFVLFNFIISLIFGILDSVFGTKNILACVYAIAVLLPSLGLSVRRLHDIGKSGWMILVTLIPIVGAIWLIVLLIKKSEPAANQYGPNPEEVEAPVVVEEAPAAPAAPAAPVEPVAPAEPEAEKPAE